MNVLVRGILLVRGLGTGPLEALSLPPLNPALTTSLTLFHSVLYAALCI